MYHGTVAEQNGLDIAIRALALARRVVPELQLHIQAIVGRLKNSCRCFNRPTPWLVCDRCDPLLKLLNAGMSRIRRQSCHSQVARSVTNINHARAFTTLLPPGNQPNCY